MGQAFFIDTIPFQMQRIFQSILIIIFVSFLTGCLGKDGLEDNGPEFHYQLAMEYLRLGNVDQAIEELKGINDKHPNNIKAYNMLGAVYSKMGRNKDALEEYKKILEIAPENISALNFIGVVHSQEKEYDKAYVYFKRALEAKPDDPFTYNNYGLSLADGGKLDQAIGMYEKALDINPKFTRVLNNMGQAYLKMGQFEKAAAAFGRAVEIDPADQMALSNLGMAYYQRDDLDKAVEYFNKVVNINPKRYFDHFHLGEIYAKKGEIEKAEAEYRYALSENPAFARAYNGLGYLYAQKGEQFKYAEEMIHKAIKLDPLNKGKYLDSLSWIYYKMGKYNMALNTAMEAKSLIEKDNGSLSFDTKYHLGMIYQKIGEKQKALQYLADYIRQEKERLKKRVEKYGKYLIAKDWDSLYRFQSPEFKSQVSSVEYGRRHPIISEARMVSSFIDSYDVGKIDISEDMTNADVNIIVTMGIKGGMVPIPKILPPDRPKAEKWENVNGIWYRSAIPDEVNPSLHISGASMRR